MSYVYELYNAEVVQELNADPQLAQIFYANFPPYDLDTDPMHNQNWVKKVAPAREAEALHQAKLALKRAQVWLQRA